MTLTLSCSNTVPETTQEDTVQTPVVDSIQPAPVVAELRPAAQPVEKAVPKSKKPKKGNRKQPLPATKLQPAQVITPEPAAPAPSSEMVSIENIEPKGFNGVEFVEVPQTPAPTEQAPAAPAPTQPDSETAALNAKLGGFEHKPFLPTRRRIDREINKIKFAYKGEVMMGMTASYGTLSSDDTDILLILTDIDASGTIASIKPFIGYFYRDNNCLGVRFGYNHLSGTVDNMGIDIDQANDIGFDVPYFNLKSNNYAFGIFHRSYAGLDPKGRFGLFAEFELSVSSGSSEFSYESGDVLRYVSSDNTQVKLSFNPGAAVYIFPNVCATLSFGLGGIQYTSTKQKDAEGNLVGTRKASNMKFKLNIAAINFGLTIHLWDKKKK